MSQESICGLGLEKPFATAYFVSSGHQFSGARWSSRIVPRFLAQNGPNFQLIGGR
jgi:hypothetical protein